MFDTYVKWFRPKSNMEPEKRGLDDGLPYLLASGHFGAPR